MPDATAGHHRRPIEAPADRYPAAVRILAPFVLAPLVACGEPPPEPEVREPYAPEHCAYFLTGEVDTEGTDADGDGVGNGWDHCPNNGADWLDSDRDGIGNRSDPDMDGDGVDNADDADRDGDGAADADEQAAGTDPEDPSSIPGAARAEVDLGVLNSEPGWYRGDLHVHTEPSHDSSQPLSGWVQRAPQVGLDFLWITDHRVFEAPFDPAWDQRDVLLIPGIEWGGPGHANIGGLRTLAEADYNDPADVLRSWRLAKLQGSVQSLNHYGDDADYWEATFAAEPALLDELDVFEVWNVWWPASLGVNPPSIARWEALLSDGYRIGAVGGSDAHDVALPVGFPTTVVWARTLSVPGILDGLRRGRSYVTQAYPYMAGEDFSYEARPTLDFRADGDGDGEFEAMLGDALPAGEVTLRVQVDNAHGPLFLIRDGDEVASSTDHEPGGDAEIVLTEAANAGSWYRVEMRLNDDPDSALLLFSSPIYVE